MSNPLDMLPPLVEDWPFPLFLIEPEDETILWANQAAQEWLEKSMRKIVGQTPWDLVSIVEEEASVISKCRELNAPVTLRDCAINRTDREEQFCHLTAYPTDSGIGLSVWIVGPRPRSAKVGGQLVTGMGRMIAHELKNPLAGIKGAAQLLRDDVEGEEGQSLIELIGSEIDRIRRLADRMETLGDQDPDNVDRVNIHEILRRARQVIQSANPNLIFTERYDPTQHLPIEICIIDNGPGIAKHIASQLFQPFVSTKPEGQGLGLSLVSKVAAAHGGLVEVKSRPGKTKFSLLLTDGETL